MTVQAKLLQDTEHGQELGAFQGELQEGARVEQLDAPRLAPKKGIDEQNKQKDENGDQHDDNGHGKTSS